MNKGFHCLRCRKRFHLILPRRERSDLYRCGCPEGRNTVAIARAKAWGRDEAERKPQAPRADHRGSAFAHAFNKRGAAQW